MRTPFITLILGSSICICACGSSTPSLSSGAGSASGGIAGGTGSGPVDGNATTSTIVSVELGWGGGMDAASKSYNATVTPDGTATCRVWGSPNGWTVLGQTAQPDQELQSLLAQPDVVTALTTPCFLNNVTDVGGGITTTLANGSKVERMDFYSCSATGITNLVAAVQRVCGSESLVSGGVDGAVASDGPLVDASTIDTSGCSCAGGTTTWDCYCQAFDCNKTLDAYTADGGASKTYVARYELTGCNMASVIVDLTSFSELYEVYDLTTRKLIGEYREDERGLHCPLGTAGDLLRSLTVGASPAPGCRTTKCVKGDDNPGNDMCSGVDAGSPMD